MPTLYPMAIEPGSRYPAWPWQIARGVKTEKSTLSGAAKLWKAFRRGRRSKRELTILATWTSQDDRERSNSKKHIRSSSRNLLNLTVRTGGGHIIEQDTQDASPFSSKSQSTVQPSVFDYTPASPANSTTTYEPASSYEDLVVTHSPEFQFSDLDTDTEFWYDGILPDDRSFPGAYDDSSCIRPFTPAEGLTPDLSLKDFPNPPSLLPYSRSANPEPRGSFRSSSLSKRSSSLRAAALRKSRSCDSQVVNTASDLGADTQWRELGFHLSPSVPFLQPPKPLRFSKRVSSQSQRPTGRFGYNSRKTSQRTSGSQGKRDFNRLSSYSTSRDSPRKSNSIHQDSHLMHHILSTLQIQEEWEKDGDSIREHFARKPTLARNSGFGVESRPQRVDDAMTARKQLLARLQGVDWRISDCTNTDTDVDVEDLFSACTGHFRSVVSATLSLGSSIGSRGSRSFLVSRRSSAGRGEKVRTSFEGECVQEEVDALQWCDVIDLGEYLFDVDRS